MTRIKAIEYGVARHEYRTIGEDIPEVLVQKNGEFQTATWSELDYAKTCGWTYAGSIADAARELGMI